jgi:hypothetical protein
MLRSEPYYRRSHRDHESQDFKVGQQPGAAGAGPQPAEVTDEGLCRHIIISPPLPPDVIGRATRPRSRWRCLWSRRWFLARFASEAPEAASSRNPGRNHLRMPRATSSKSAPLPPRYRIRGRAYSFKPGWIPMLCVSGLIAIPDRNWTFGRRH